MSCGALPSLGIPSVLGKVTLVLSYRLPGTPSQLLTEAHLYLQTL